MGHEAGDKLIVQVADILNEAVPDGTVCRISGDEFVGIVKNVDIDDFTGKMNGLKDVMRKNGRIASFGYTVGEGKNIYDVIKSAEKIMYADKENYYIETGKDRRK